MTLRSITANFQASKWQYQRHKKKFDSVKRPGIGQANQKEKDEDLFILLSPVEFNSQINRE
jgi:hypothetical protein